MLGMAILAREPSAAGHVDCLTSLARKLGLVPSNEREFRRMAGLRINNWASGLRPERRI